MYVKLPSWFKIETPIGSYNTDWSVVINEIDEKRLYFVLETKGKSHINLLREEEQSKIKCDKKHFEALGEKVEFMALESNHDEFMEKARDVFA